MEKNFKLEGNVLNATRSDNEMKLIDINKADKAFKCHKHILDQFMIERGFHVYSDYSYIRKNNVDVVEYVDLQPDTYGSKTFTVNYLLMPLYVKHSFISFDLGGRLGYLINDKDVWWDYSNERKAETSFKNVSKAIDDILLPWFDEHASDTALKEALLHEKRKRESLGGNLSKNQVAWIDAIDHRNDYVDVIIQNVEELKLPVFIV